MKNIIVPIDFSETSATALRFGTELAIALKHNLEVVHVDDLGLSGGHSITASGQREHEERLKSRLTLFTRKHTSQVFSRAGTRRGFLPEVNVFLYAGPAAARLLELSGEERTGLIVMGGVGAGAGLRLPGLYGSVATPVATRGGCPVILIPREAAITKIKRLAVAFDDADELRQTSAFVQKVLDGLEAETRYVHVRKPDEEAEADNEAAFRAAVQDQEIPTQRFTLDVLTPGDVADQLSAYCGTQAIDLLVLGGKRQGFWKRLFDKDNLSPLLRTVRVPMLVVPFKAGGGKASAAGLGLSEGQSDRPSVLA